MIRTLIIDDDHAVAGIHQGFLMAHGAFEVVGVAHTGTDGLEAVRRLAPDLVLLDIHLPGLSGLEVLRALRGEGGSRTDVFAITASRELETVRAALAGGVVQYLVKPFTSAEFRQRLDQYIERRRELSERARDGGALDQGAIDRLLGGPSAGPAAAPAAPATRGEASPVPKGLSRTTLDAVAAALRGIEGDASAADVAGLLGLARVSARRYLEHLVASGRARLAPRYGSAGRPENRYSWIRRPEER